MLLLNIVLASELSFCRKHEQRLKSGLMSLILEIQLVQQGINVTQIEFQFFLLVCWNWRVKWNEMILFPCWCRVWAAFYLAKLLLQCNYEIWLLHPRGGIIASWIIEKLVWGLRCPLGTFLTYFVNLKWPLLILYQGDFISSYLVLGSFFWKWKAEIFPHDFTLDWLYYVSGSYFGLALKFAYFLL